jgi:hypothetical protein
MFPSVYIGVAQAKGDFSVPHQEGAEDKEDEDEWWE